MTSAPYVSPVKNRMGDVWAEGSPQLTDVKSLYTGGFALDVLGDIGDPLGAVIGCAVGWIVDHVDFLREPVDWLAGNPRSIEASISTWGQTWVPMRAVGCRMSR